MNRKRREDRKIEILKQNIIHFGTNAPAQLNRQEPIKLVSHTHSIGRKKCVAIVSNTKAKINDFELFWCLL